MPIMWKHSCPKKISPQSRKARRERNFIRISEREILIKVFAFFPKGLSAVCVAGSIHSIFPPLRGKYYEQILSDLSGSIEAGGKWYFPKGTLKKWNLNFGLPTAFKEIRRLSAKKNELRSILDSNDVETLFF